MKKTPPTSPKKATQGLHARNPHLGSYDFEALMGAHPPLAPFVKPARSGRLSVDFADPDAVNALNTALLKQHYGVNEWAIPAGYLCPPIPGRADYIHHLADLLGGDGEPPRGQRVRILDVGTGANLVYPLIGTHAYGWRFVGSDIDPVALENAGRILSANTHIASKIELRQQPDSNRVLHGIMADTEYFDAVMCNPPFYASRAEADQNAARKVKNLGRERHAKPARKEIPRNFGGQQGELWCKGGEQRFLRTLIAESTRFALRCVWFTSLVSRQETLGDCYTQLKEQSAREIRTIKMYHGNKISRLLAWTFFTPEAMTLWKKHRR